MLDKRGQDDFRFSTYQVNRGAERLFEQAGFEDGDKVSEATFYALLLDGDLYNDARPDGIEISSVPDKILAFAEQEIRPIQKDLTIFARAVVSSGRFRNAHASIHECFGCAISCIVAVHFPALGSPLFKIF